MQKYSGNSKVSFSRSSPGWVHAQAEKRREIFGSGAAGLLIICRDAPVRAHT
jgi:hypothetical protein